MTSQVIVTQIDMDRAMTKLLFNAILSNDIEGVKFYASRLKPKMLQTKFSLWNSMTCLHLATLLNRVDMADILIKAGASLDAKDGDDRTPAQLGDLVGSRLSLDDERELAPGILNIMLDDGEEKSVEICNAKANYAKKIDITTSLAYSHTNKATGTIIGKMVLHNRVMVFVGKSQFQVGGHIYEWDIPNDANLLTFDLNKFTHGHEFPPGLKRSTIGW